MYEDLLGFNDGTAERRTLRDRSHVKVTKWGSYRGRRKTDSPPPSPSFKSCHPDLSEPQWREGTAVSRPVVPMAVPGLRRARAARLLRTTKSGAEEAL